jgi:hypothetical protein
MQVRNFNLIAHPKKPASSEHEKARNEDFGHCENAALAVFQRDLLGEHHVSNR